MLSSGAVGGGATVMGYVFFLSRRLDDIKILLEKLNGKVQKHEVKLAVLEERERES